MPKRKHLVLTLKAKSNKKEQLNRIARVRLRINITLKGGTREEKKQIRKEKSLNNALGGLLKKGNF